MILIYMAKPVYGGWVSFTSHMSLKYNLELFKIGKRTELLKSGEIKKRDFGYGVFYQNYSIYDIINYKDSDILITAIDKNYYKYLDNFPDGTKIVIHDPTEVTGKSSKPVLANLHRFKVFTIRKTVQLFLQEKYNIKSTFLVHPFYKYSKTDNQSKLKSVAISRIDFDKNTDMIIETNELLSDKKMSYIEIYGKKNDLYVYHCITQKLNKLEEFEKYYKSSFKKSFEELNNILSESKAVIDMSSIKNDGGGSQYTFLEAIYQNCILVLNKKWVNGKNTEFINGKNCLIVENALELYETILFINNKNNNQKISKIIKKSKKMIEPHINVNWVTS